jgi:DNA-directed RNA polymerase specialized sigma24 family protein
MTAVTVILSRIDQGDPTAADQLLPLVYNELRQLAAAKLANEKPGQTLQATALVHEAYLRLVGNQGEKSGVRGQKLAGENANSGLRPPTSDLWNSRGHFFAAAAEAMRRILVEAARRRGRVKHGAGRERQELAAAEIVAPEGSDNLLALDEALDRLAKEDPPSAELVKLRYFAGLTIPQAAQALGISPRKADFLWSFARAWLRREIDGES